MHVCRECKASQSSRPSKNEIKSTAPISRGLRKRSASAGKTLLHAPPVPACTSIHCDAVSVWEIYHRLVYMMQRRIIIKKQGDKKDRSSFSTKTRKAPSWILRREVFPGFWANTMFSFDPVLCLYSCALVDELRLTPFVFTVAFF